MTEEELEMEAEEKYHNHKIEDFQGFYPRNYYCLGYVESAEPREKRIAELELKIKHLTEHLEPQAMTSLFEQVEEEVKQEQKVKELEKENAELKTKKIPQLERKIASIRGAHSVDCKKLNARTEQVERLKTENAELRNQASAMSKALALNIPEADKKLIKAKELLKEMLSVLPKENIEGIYEITVEAEQFLEECK